MKNSLSHIAFIMDGNNRWSKKTSFSKHKSYMSGADNLIKLSRMIFNETEVKYISAFALSRNNLQRSSTVINSIKKVLLDSLEKLQTKKLNFDIKFIGSFDFLNSKTKKMILDINKQQKNEKKLIIYLNYGGREDIEEASLNFKRGKKNFNKFLLTSDISDPDILIRTGGYQRISNFLLYQLAFTELFFLKKLWPDLTPSDLRKIFINFYKIERKFGK